MRGEPIARRRRSARLSRRQLDRAIRDVALSKAVTREASMDGCSRAKQQSAANAGLDERGNLNPSAAHTLA
jgi:hypothetical protein